MIGPENACYDSQSNPRRSRTRAAVALAALVFAAGSIARDMEETVTTAQRITIHADGNLLADMRAAAGMAMAEALRIELAAPDPDSASINPVCVATYREYEATCQKRSAQKWQANQRRCMDLNLGGLIPDIDTAVDWDTREAVDNCLELVRSQYEIDLYGCTTSYWKAYGRECVTASGSE